VELRTGQSLIDAGVGFAGDTENNARTRRMDTSFVQLDWRRSLDADQDLALQFSHTIERIRDAFVYTPAPSLTVDFGGKSSNSNLLLQHTVRVNPALRLVWGGELRRESVVSRPLYNTDAAFNNDFARIFTNVEWRLHPDLLLNAGALLEDSSQSGRHNAPRVMLNWRVAEGHTLRGGVSKAFRPPSTYEKYANVRYYIGGVLAESTDVARGGMLAEKVLVREVGYLAELPSTGFSFDLRLFDEHVTGLVGREAYALPGSGGNNQAFDFVNDEDFRTHGYEFQLRWKPWDGGQLVYAYASVDSTQFYNSTTQVGRYVTQGLMFTQQLPAGLAFSLIHSQADAGYYPGFNQPMPAVRRTDLRLAKALRLAGQAAELALVGQNLGAAYPDFRPEFRYPQRVYVQLRVEH
ncbi:MAG: TonB-dependent receptor, partial [Curvibacter sp.]